VTDDLRRSRLTVFFRLFLALPHLVWLTLWGIAAQLAAFANWLAVLINAESPPVFHNFLVGYVRYATHVNAYLFLAGNPFPGFRGRPGYPVDVDFDPPSRQSRWSALFRLPLLLPPLILAMAVGWLGWASGASTSASADNADTAQLVTLAPGLIGIAAIGVWFAALIRARSPRGLRDVSAYALGYSAQVLAYAFLLTSRYPDSHPGRLLGDPAVPYHPVRLRVEDDLRRSRFTVLFRLLLAIPHIVWLTGWSVLAYLAAILNWFVALIGGRSWRPLHRFIAAFVRYQAHVYAFLYLVANPFPGFTGRESAYPLAIVIDGPERQRRLVTLFRLLLALPAIVLYSAFSSVLLAVAIGGWFVSLVTGRMPSGLRALGAVIIRYSAQVTAYLLVLTDRYPNSSPALRAEPAPGTEPVPPPAPWTWPESEPEAQPAAEPELQPPPAPPIQPE
jgi:hypothetical protein